MIKQQLEIEIFSDQFNSFPGTRYMGSKNKIIKEIWEILKCYNFQTFYDAFAGSNTVGYFMKCQGKEVITNDFMSMSYHMSKAIIENNNIKINDKELEFLIEHENNADFITQKFKGLYFSDFDNQFLDRVRSNIESLDNEYKKSIALSALIRSCVKKRPRGIFTFVGQRYNDGRQDMKSSLKEHFINNIEIFNSAVFESDSNCNSYNSSTQSLDINVDLVYLDPPYYSPNSDNDYVRRYHFVEGLVRNWNGLEIQENTITKKFKSYKSPFSNRLETYSEFDKLFDKFKSSIIAVSYSSNSLPTKNEIIEMLGKYKSKVTVFEIDHVYSFGTQAHKIGNVNNRVKEYIFIGE